MFIKCILLRALYDVISTAFGNVVYKDLYVKASSAAIW